MMRADFWVVSEIEVWYIRTASGSERVSSCSPPNTRSLPLAVLPVRRKVEHY